jgi:hypothetical protein
MCQGRRFDLEEREAPLLSQEGWREAQGLFRSSSS